MSVACTLTPTYTVGVEILNCRKTERTKFVCLCSFKGVLLAGALLKHFMCMQPYIFHHPPISRLPGSTFKAVVCPKSLNFSIYNFYFLFWVCMYIQSRCPFQTKARSEFNKILLRLLSLPVCNKTVETKLY